MNQNLHLRTVRGQLSQWLDFVEELSLLVALLELTTGAKQKKPKQPETKGFSLKYVINIKVVKNLRSLISLTEN